MATILLIDDDDLFLDAAAKTVEAVGHQVIVANSAQEGIEKLNSNKIDVLVSDIRMPDINGLRLAQQIKQNHPQVPIVLMTAFSEILETQAAHDIGVTHFITKPFKSDELSRAINSCLGVADDRVKDDQEYCKVAIDDFITGKEIKFNIFVRLSNDKYVKIAHQGEDISVDRIRAYKKSGMQYLFLKEEDFLEYVSFNVGLTKAMGANKKVNKQKKLSLIRHTGEILQQRLRIEGVNPENFQASSTFVDTVINLMSSNSESLDMISALNEHSDHLYAHSVGVCLYSLMIANILEWKITSNRYKLAMAALFHDIGLKEIDRSILSRPRLSWKTDEIKLYETHPQRGFVILSQMDCIPEEVAKIVQQHHEDCTGRGYPNRLKASAIHPMAKIISIADEFCYRVIKGPLGEATEPVEAIKKMITHHSKNYDPVFLEALGRIFNVKI